MKRCISLLMISLLVAALITPLFSIGLKANAETTDGWVAIGNSIPGYSSTYSPKFAIDNGTPYIAVPVGTTSVAIYKYDGSAWTQICSQAVPYIDFGFDVRDGVPYLAIPGSGASTKIQKFNGTSWEQVGAAISNHTNERLLAIAPDGTLYYNARGSNGWGIYYYSGSAWRLKRSYGSNNNDCSYPDIQACENAIYVSFMNVGVSRFVINELPYDSTAPTSVTVSCEYPTMYVENGIKYVAYKETGLKLTVSRVEGSETLVNIGPSGFAPESSTMFPDSYSVAVLDGIPYAAYADNRNIILVKKYDASTNTWVNAGNNVSSLGKWRKTDMVANNGKIYLMASDNYTNKTIQLYSMQITADKSGLNQIIAEAEAINPEIYTPLSWSQLQASLIEARNSAADTTATQAQIDAAGAALRNSISALVEKGDKTSLIALLEETRGMQKDNYVLASWNKFAAAVSRGESVVNDENASRSDVLFAEVSIRLTRSKLQPAIRKEALGITIRSCLALTESEYAAESWAAMQEELASAINVYNALPGDTFGDGTSTLTSVTQANVDSTNSKLLAAIAALQGNPRNIINTISEQASELDGSAFEPQSWVHFSLTLSNAQAVANDPNASDEEVQEQLGALSDAIGGLQGAVELPEYPDVYIIDANGNEAYIYGTVDASIVSAEVTLSTYFHINPNAAEGERFLSPDMTVKNTSTMPINIAAISMVATGDAPKVAAPDTYGDSEWAQLSSSETAAKIALGFVGSKTGDFFFDNEAEQTPVALGGLNSQEEMALRLQAKFGLSWPLPRVFKYETVFRIALNQ